MFRAHLTERLSTLRFALKNTQPKATQKAVKSEALLTERLTSGIRSYVLPDLPEEKNSAKGRTNWRHHKVTAGPLSSLFLSLSLSLSQTPQSFDTVRTEERLEIRFRSHPDGCLTIFRYVRPSSSEGRHDCLSAFRC